MPATPQRLIFGELSRSRWFMLLWALGRCFMLLTVVYLLREPLLNGIEKCFDIGGVTEFMIDRGATPLSRVLLAVGACVVFWSIAWVSGRLVPRRMFVVSILCVTMFATLVSLKTGGGGIVVVAVTVLLSTNWARLSGVKRLDTHSRWIDRSMAILPGVGEIFFSSHYIDWLRKLVRSEDATMPLKKSGYLPGALIAGTVLAWIIPGKKLIRYEQALRCGPDVRIVARGDFNGIAYDASHERLIATGHGVPRVLSFDTANPGVSPQEADVDTGAAQGLVFDPENGEIYIYNSDEGKILVLEARTLKLKRSIPAPDISPGDSWIAVSLGMETLVIASEADEQRGDPFVVFDRSTGEVLAKRNDEPGNLLVNPESPILYMSFFRRVGRVVAYDLQKREVLAKATTGVRMDRMAYDPFRKQLLIASPADGLIRTFDSLTLEPEGSFKAIAAVRVIAVDAAEKVMLVGSLISGKVALMGLDDRKVKRSWYIGPWLRSIEIAPGTGIAYISSAHAIYELSYKSSR